MAERVRIRPLRPDDGAWLVDQLTGLWGAPNVARRGAVIDAGGLPGFVAETALGRVGSATYRVAAGDCELVTIETAEPGRGIGTALLQAVETAAARRSCIRVWLITTNDNLRAIQFYERRGYRLVAVHEDAVAEARRLKPSIPLIGSTGVPIRDELEFEKRLR